MRNGGEKRIGTKSQGLSRLDQAKSKSKQIIQFHITNNTCASATARTFRMRRTGNLHPKINPSANEENLGHTV